MLVKNSLHLVLRCIVLAYPVWQGSKEIETSRGERMLRGGEVNGRGCSRPWLLYLCHGRAGGSSPTAEGSLGGELLHPC